MSTREAHELRTDEIAQVDRILAVVQFFERLQEDLSTAVVQLIDRGTIDDHMGQVTELKVAAFGILREIDALLASFQIDADGVQETLAKVLGVEVDHRGFETKDFHMWNFMDLNREKRSASCLSKEVSYAGGIVTVPVGFTAFVLAENG